MPTSSIISLKSPYLSFLKTRTSEDLYTHHQMNISQSGQILHSTATTPNRIIIPPMNADLNFSMLSGLYKQSIVSKFRQTLPELQKLPEYFDWKKELPDKITPVQNQGRCGSCWAFAIATALSDNFVAQKVLDMNPMISPSYLLSCYDTTSRCNGGNPAMALEWISNNGIATDEVINYDWCDKNPYCNGLKESRFVDMNQFIPACIDKQDELKFYTENITTPNLETNPYKNYSQTDIDDSIRLVKKYIYFRGPVVAGFQVYGNFYSGEYQCNEKNPDNIYLDAVDYMTCTYNPEKVLNQSEYKGGHAVVITGWGAGKVHSSLLGKGNGWEQVPYWIVRNSWSEKWGIEGYFRMAMFPFNKTSQFDTTVFVFAPNPNDSSQIEKIPSGGILMFELKYLGYSENNVMEGYCSPCSMSFHYPSFIFILSLTSLTLLLFIIILLSYKKK